MDVTISKRMARIPPEFNELMGEYITEARRQGKDIIDLSSGNPDSCTSKHIIERLVKEVRKPGSQSYSSVDGLRELREAVASWYKKRFGIILTPKTEILPLKGTRQSTAQISLVVINPGDIALIPDPGYDSYKTGVILAGGIPKEYPLHEKNDYLPVLSEISRETLRNAKLMFLNYPHNPTGSIAPLSLFEEIVGLAKENGFLVCHDNTYAEISYDGNRPRSFLQVKGAKDVGIELITLSKTYNMAGWRVGFMVGSSQIIESFRALKLSTDSGGIFLPIQKASIEALKTPQSQIDRLVKMYEKRRNTLVESLNSIGWTVKKPQGSLYVWAPVPVGKNSLDFAKELLEKAKVAVRPGILYGKRGEGYIRFTLCQSIEKITSAARRIRDNLG